MEQEKIYNQIKSAAKNSETKDFHAMDKVWNRVEEKLDKKVLKKENKLWKKIAIAASVLLVITLGYQFFKSNLTSVTPQNQVVTIDTSKTIEPQQNAIVASDSLSPIIKKDAVKILEKQITIQTQIANNEAITTDSLRDKVEADMVIPMSAASNEKAEKKTKSNPFLNRGKFNSVGVQHNPTSKESVESKKSETQNATLKLDPLLVVDGEVSKGKLSNLNDDEIDSIIELPEPLYIINKVYYTEKEMFGPNPTSPYAPLNKQEIESMTILQPEKAVTIYGEKGKKGVVIITTKNGKPKNDSR